MIESQVNNLGVNIEYALKGVTPDQLYSIGIRYNNEKRSFLFVSKILGKHIPIRPTCLEQNTYGLTSKWLEDSFSNGSLNGDDPILVIGFAETATALGHHFFTNLTGNAHYLHSTRDKIEGLESLFTIDEEHSYISDHYFYLQDKTIIENAKHIVIIDDEITSGKTAYNLIKKIDKEYPGKRYSVACFLDWRGKESVSKYDEGINGNPINVIQFLKGNIISNSIRSVQEKYSGLWNNIPIKSSYVEWEDINLHLPSYNFNNKKYLKYSGRFGISLEDNQALIEELDCLKNNVISKCMGNKILVLGQGEDMFVPNVISIILQGLNKNVFYHATTRSPALIEGAALKNGIHFGSLKGYDYTEFLYNITDKEYDEVILISEDFCDKQNLGLFMILMKSIGVKYLRHVILT